MGINVTTTWDCWNEKEKIFIFPDHWKISEYALPPQRAVSRAGMRATLTEAFEALAKRRDLSPEVDVCVLADDLTRPAYWGDILEEIHGILLARGLKKENFKILFSLGGHGKLTDEEVILKIGKACFGRFKIYQHDFD